MSDNPSPRNKSARNRKLLLAGVCIIVAGVIGVGLGAIAYRHHVQGKRSGGTTVVDATYSGIANPVGGFPLGSRYPAQFTTKSIYPKFNPNTHYYVTRCVPGKIAVDVRANDGVMVKVGPYEPMTGRFQVEPRPMPGQDFNINIDDGTSSKNYEVRCLPDDFPFWEYKRFKNPPKGMFFTTFRPDPKDQYRNWAVVWDQNGTPRWWMPTVTNTLGGQILPDGTVQFPRGFGDGFGKDPRAADEIHGLDGKLQRLVKIKGGTATDGHEYLYLPNGNVIIDGYKPRYPVDLTSIGGKKVSGTLDGYLQEQTPSGKVVWTWNSKDHIPLTSIGTRWRKALVANKHPDINGHDQVDVFHFNSIDPYGKNQYIVSARHTDAVWGISKKTGDVLWKFGGLPSPESLKIEGNDPHKDYPIAGQHDARMTGNILSVHDNATNIEGRQPRMVRYRIDLKNRTATFVSQGTDPKIHISHCCGSVRPFGTGFLVAWGNSPYITGFTADEQIAFRMRVPIPVYRAVPVPKSVTAADLDKGLDEQEPDIPQATVPVNPPKIFNTR